VSAASEAPDRERAEPERVSPALNVRAAEPEVAAPVLAAGNAAPGRMLVRRTPAAGAMGDLARVGGNSEMARLAGPVMREPVGAPPAPGDLRAGAQGEAVADAQLKLSRVQASAQPPAEDGRYGPLTEAAVRTGLVHRGPTRCTSI
jgi:hypothetical protein